MQDYLTGYGSGTTVYEYDAEGNLISPDRDGIKLKKAVKNYGITSEPDFFTAFLNQKVSTTLRIDGSWLSTKLKASCA